MLCISPLLLKLNPSPFIMSIMYLLENLKNHCEHALGHNLVRERDKTCML